MSIRIPVGGRGVRLDVALVVGAGVELVFDEDIGRCESSVDVTDRELDVAGDVRPLLGGRCCTSGLCGAQVIVQDRRLRTHGILGRHHRRKDLVIDLNEVESIFGNVDAGGRDGRYRMTVKQHLPHCKEVADEETASL